MRRPRVVCAGDHQPLRDDVGGYPEENAQHVCHRAGDQIDCRRVATSQGRGQHGVLGFRVPDIVRYLGRNAAEDVPAEPTIKRAESSFFVESQHVFERRELTRRRARSCHLLPGLYEIVRVGECALNQRVKCRKGSQSAHVPMGNRTSWDPAAAVLPMKK